MINLWADRYIEIQRTAEDAIRLIKPGNRVFVGICCYDCQAYRQVCGRRRNDPGGLGVLHRAIVTGLLDKNDLGIHTRFLSDEIMHLYKSHTVTEDHMISLSCRFDEPK